MARLARIAVPGVAHPVTQRGDNKQDALFVADGKRVYLEHAFNAPRYAGSNQMRLGMVRRSWRYPWSSAAALCGKAASNPLLDLAGWRETMPPEEWIETLGAFAEDANATNAIRRGTRTGPSAGQR